MYRSSIRIGIYHLIIALFSLVFIVGCTNYSSVPVAAPLAASSDSSNPSSGQVASGFENFDFPTPELAQNEQPLATGAISAETAPVSVGRLSQAALGNVGNTAAEVSNSVPVVSGLAAQTQPANTAVHRPIPTVSAEEAVNAAVIATRNVAAGTMQPFVAVDRAMFVDYLRSYRDNLRELVFITDTALPSGELSCDNVQQYMAALDAVPHQMNVPLDLQLASYHLQIAFEQADVAFRPLANYCASVAGIVNVTTIQPAETMANIFPTAQYALNNVYDAVLWVNGDSAKVRDLYMTTRGKIADYNALLAIVSNTTCAQLNALYEGIVYSPTLSLPEGQVANTYQHYIGAINSVANGGSNLYQTCGAIIAQGSGNISPEMVANTQSAVVTGLNQIDVAITYLP
ncbi:MAG TPA: hypothetical protein ENJ56_06120 [Anaerolineae bacterium]|nr:hypothetical protein [Anaerolineae bacterium]